MDSLNDLVKLFPKRNEGKVCVVYGNGLSLLPYESIGTRIVQSADREKALRQQWYSLENEIRLPSLDLFSSGKKALGGIGNLFLAILAKEKIANPLITTNWDAFFDSAASHLDLNYSQNPCLDPFTNEGPWFGYKTKVNYKPDMTRVWKPHGDIRYVWLTCCDLIKPLTPLSRSKKLETLYPSEELLHLDCKNEKKTKLQHHILPPYPSQMMQEKFKSEIDGSKAEIKSAQSKDTKMILVIGFSGWDYEELVDPIIGRIGQIPIFYVTNTDWRQREAQGKDVPKLWAALKNEPNSVIIFDSSKTLLSLTRSSGCYDKYHDLLKRYVRRLDD